MRRLIWPPIVIVLALFLGACATFNNIPAPETPRERLTALDISYQETSRGIQDLVASGTLHGNAAARVADFLEAALEAMRVARAGIDGPDGLELLEAANKALLALTARLQAEESQ